jgi:hypothetical protein
VGLAPTNHASLRWTHTFQDEPQGKPVRYSLLSTTDFAQLSSPARSLGTAISEYCSRRRW